MKYLVDGNNLIYKFPHLEQFMYGESMENARSGLVQLLAEFAEKSRKDEIILFFDGWKDKQSAVDTETIGKIRIYYSCRHKADDLIKDYIKMSATLSDLCVTTSDKDILFFAKRFKIQSYTSEAFAKFILDLLSSEEADAEEAAIEEIKKDSGFWQKLFKL